MAVLLLLPLIPLVSSAENADVEALWARKESEIEEAKIYDYAHIQGHDAWPRPQAFDTGYAYVFGFFKLYPLLYTKQVRENLHTRIVRVGWNDDQYNYCEIIDYFAGYGDQVKEEYVMIVVDEFLELYKSQANIKRQSSGQDDLPLMRVIVDQFGITKEELYDAYDLMENDPDCIRDGLDLTDEEWNEHFAPATRKLLDADSPKYDALFLEDAETARQLLAGPGVARVDGQTVTLYKFNNSRYNDLTLEDLLKKDLSTRSFALFVRYLERSVEAGLYTDPVFGGLTGAEVLSALKDARQKRMSGNFVGADQNQPDTGDNTTVFAIVGLLSLLAVGTATWTAFKKRKTTF